jgi:hypothetical protein
VFAGIYRAYQTTGHRSTGAIGGGFAGLLLSCIGVDPAMVAILNVLRMLLLNLVGCC